MCTQNLAFVPTYTFRNKSMESFINEAPDQYVQSYVAASQAGGGLGFGRGQGFVP